MQLSHVSLFGGGVFQIYLLQNPHFSWFYFNGKHGNSRDLWPLASKPPRPTPNRRSCDVIQLWSERLRRTKDETSAFFRGRSMSNWCLSTLKTMGSLKKVQQQQKTWKNGVDSKRPICRSMDSMFFFVCLHANGWFLRDQLVGKCTSPGGSIESGIFGALEHEMFSLSLWAIDFHGKRVVEENHAAFFFGWFGDTTIALESWWP